MDKVKDLQGNPCTGPTSTNVFYRLSSGRCGEHTITDLDTCTRAGRALDLDDLEASEADRVAGCYYDEYFDFVFFNSDSDGKDCTDTDNCICYGRVDPQQITAMTSDHNIPCLTTRVACVTTTLYFANAVTTAHTDAMQRALRMLS